MAKTKTKTVKQAPKLANDEFDADARSYIINANSELIKLALNVDTLTGVIELVTADGTHRANFNLESEV